MPLQQLAVDEHRAAAPLPAFAPGPQPRQRPASASTVERMAGMLRSISFAAGQPPTGTSGADSARSQACAAVAASVRRDFAGAAIGRLVESAPHVALALQGAVLASAGVLLGAEAATMAFEWARSSLDDLRHFVAAGARLLCRHHSFPLFRPTAPTLLRRGSHGSALPRRLLSGDCRGGRRAAGRCAY